MAEARSWQRILLRQVMRIVFFAAIPALLFSSYYVWKDGKGWLIPFYVVGFVVIGIMQFWKKAPYALQTGTLLAILYMFATLSLIRGGVEQQCAGLPVGVCLRCYDILWETGCDCQCDGCRDDDGDCRVAFLDGTVGHPYRNTVGDS